MRTVIDTREVHTAADLLELIEQVAALGYKTDTMHLHTADGDVQKVSLVQERLSDRSLVWNLSFH